MCVVWLRWCINLRLQINLQTLSFSFFSIFTSLTHSQSTDSLWNQQFMNFLHRLGELWDMIITSKQEKNEMKRIQCWKNWMRLKRTICCLHSRTIKHLSYDDTIQYITIRFLKRIESSTHSTKNVFEARLDKIFLSFFDLSSMAIGVRWYFTIRKPKQNKYCIFN